MTALSHHQGRVDKSGWRSWCSVQPFLATSSEVHLSVGATFLSRNARLVGRSEQNWLRSRTVVGRGAAVSGLRTPRCLMAGACCR